MSFGKPDWNEIHRFLLEVGAEREPEKFCLQTLDKINTLIPFDSAVLFLLDRNGEVYKNALVEVEPRWSRAYLDYYNKLEGEAYSFHRVASGSVVNWDVLPETEYVVDFVRPQHYNYTATLQFRDDTSRLTCAMAFNRFSRKSGFLNKEVEILNTVMPHLVNLYANLYVSVKEHPIKECSGERLREALADQFPILTKREAEIAVLLCQRASTAMIGMDLAIETRTVYKHIENIFTKLQVSSRQQLVSKILATKVKEA